jgi:hypothetical protein
MAELKTKRHKQAMQWQSLKPKDINRQCNGRTKNQKK